MHFKYKYLRWGGFREGAEIMGEGQVLPGINTSPGLTCGEEIQVLRHVDRGNSERKKNQ